MLNSARAVQGVGAAIMFAVSLALLAHAFPTRASVPGRWPPTAPPSAPRSPSARWSAGCSRAASTGSGSSSSTCRSASLCLWITRTYVEESRDPHWRGIDWPGQITLTAGLFLLVLALLRGNEDGWGSTLIVAELAGAALALLAFVVVELRVREPMLPMRLFRDATFTGAQIAAFAISASFFAIFLYATLYLQQILGLSAIEAGLVYLPGTILMLFVSGATAQMGAKVPARTMIAGGLALVAAGMVLFTLADETSSWWMVMPGAAGRLPRHRPVQPGALRGRARLRAGRAERPRRRRQRHGPPGRHRRRRRRSRRPDPGRGGAQRRLGGRVRGRPARRVLRRRRAGGGGRRRGRAADRQALRHGGPGRGPVPANAVPEAA